MVRCQRDGLPPWQGDLGETLAEVGRVVLQGHPGVVGRRADGEGPPGAGDGENVVLSHSGWGDGFYPVVTTHDAEGRLLGVHLDLLVADTVHWMESRDQT